MKRFNEWRPAFLIACELAAETGARFSVARSRFPAYGWYWWEVRRA